MFRKQLCLFIVFFDHYVKFTATECVNGYIYPHPDNFGLYYRCSNGYLIEMEFPGVLDFNPLLSTCECATDITVLFSRIHRLKAKSKSLESKLLDLETKLAQSTRSTQSSKIEVDLLSRLEDLDARTIALESKSLELETISTQLDIRSTVIETISSQMGVALAELVNLMYHVKNSTSNLDFDSTLTKLDIRSAKIEAKSNRMETTLTKLVNEMNNIKSSTSTLESTSNELSTSMNSLKTRTTSVESTTATLNTSVDNLKKTAVTNIRLGPLEREVCYFKYGLQDLGQSKVITSVINYNNDAYIDFVEQRKIEKFVDGKWSNLY